METQVDGLPEPSEGSAKSSGAHPDRTLLIELSPPMLQLKELQVKCQTSFEQVMIEFEDQIIIAIPISYQHQRNQHRGQFLRGYQVRDRSQEPIAAGTPNGGAKQQTHRRKNVILNRVIQDSNPSSACSQDTSINSLKVFIISLAVVFMIAS